MIMIYAVWGNNLIPRTLMIYCVIDTCSYAYISYLVQNHTNRYLYMYVHTYIKKKFVGISH